MINSRVEKRKISRCGKTVTCGIFVSIGCGVFTAVDVETY